MSTVPFHLSSFYTDDIRQIEYAVKNGISWFDIMYPRDSDALMRELKVGKYAVPAAAAADAHSAVHQLSAASELAALSGTSSAHTLSGHKRRRN